MARKRKRLPCDFIQCMNEECPLRDKCLRAVEDETCYMRARTKAFAPDENGECEWFIERGD